MTPTKQDAKPGRKPYLVHESRVKWEKRLAEWLDEDEDGRDSASLTERAVFWTLLDLKAAEALNADMLEALKAASAELGRLLDITDDVDAAPISEAIRVAEAAITKAEGKS